MRLRDFIADDSIELHLAAAGKDGAFRELISMLRVDDKAKSILRKMLKRREQMGSTGIGRGIAIPHCRSPVTDRLLVVFGRKPQGIEFDAIDDRPVHSLFLLVAPPLEISNQYLPVLGRIAQFCGQQDVPDRLLGLNEPADLYRLFEEKQV